MTLEPRFLYSSIRPWCLSNMEGVRTPKRKPMKLGKKTQVRVRGNRRKRYKKEAI